MISPATTSVGVKVAIRNYGADVGPDRYCREHHS